jgi:hypothetical protein
MGHWLVPVKSADKPQRSTLKRKRRRRQGELRGGCNTIEDLSMWSLHLVARKDPIPMHLDEIFDDI